MKIRKISLKNFFYEKNIPDISNIKYAYRKKEETRRHILIEYLSFNKLKKIIWANKVKKARYN